MRDYAQKKGFHGKRPSSKKTRRQEIIPGWVWTLMGITLGLGLAIFIALKLFPKLTHSGESLISSSEKEQEQKQEQKQEKKQPSPEKPMAQAPAAPKFDFYTLLPKMEEIDNTNTNINNNTTLTHIAKTEPSVIKAAPTPAVLEKSEKIEKSEKSEKPEKPEKLEKMAQPDVPSASVKTEVFILQAAVFQSSPPAEALKAELTLQGFDVKVEAYQKNNAPSPLWRVYLGPFKEESQARATQRSLQEIAQVDSFMINNKIKIKNTNKV